MSKTVKQIADELGVTKQAVHQKRKSKELATALQPFTTMVDGVVYISVDGEELIKQAFFKHDCKQVDGSFATTVDGSFTPSFAPPENSEGSKWRSCRRNSKRKENITGRKINSSLIH